MNTLAPSIVTARDRKGLKFVSIVEAAYNKANLSEEEAQRVNDTPGLGELISNFIVINRLPNKFDGEEVSTKHKCGYPSGYVKPKGLIEQINRLRELFPGLDHSAQFMDKFDEQGGIKLPPGAEGWFAIPNWVKNPKIFGMTYCDVVQKILDVVKKTRNGKFSIRHEVQITEKHLRQSARSKQFWEDLSEAQGNPDILIVPAQFGTRHRGRSARRAREVFIGNEFGLGVFVVGIMILTHPERLMDSDDLYIDCAGDEFSDSGNADDFNRVLLFNLDCGIVRFSSRWTGDAHDIRGSASGFLPQ